jgi:cysteine desulfurase
MKKQGIGALFIKKGLEINKFMIGANHERDVRAGTLNTPYISAFGLSAKLLKENLNQNIQKMSFTRDFLKNSFLERFPQICRVNGFIVFNLTDYFILSIRLFLLFD